MSANKTIWLSFCSPLPTFKVNFSKGNRFIWPGSQHLTYGHIFAASPPAADDKSAPPHSTNGWVKLSGSTLQILGMPQYLIVSEISAFIRTDGHGYMAISTRLVKRFLLPVTYFPTNLVYPFTLRVTGIKNYALAVCKAWINLTRLK